MLEALRPADKSYTKTCTFAPLFGAADDGAELLGFMVLPR
jgi:hypothetical protein